MKNVAATSGQSVSLAILFLVVVMGLEGNWAGRDKELNFYSRPPKRSSLSALRQSEFASEEYKTRSCMQQQNALERDFFLPLLSVLLHHSPASSPTRSALLPISSSAPSILRGCDRLRRLLRAFKN